MTISIPILSFFSGGGFLDLGFERAGFDVIWTNEYKESFADMHEAGISSWRESCGHPKPDKAQISERSSIVDVPPEKIITHAFGSIKPDFFGIIGEHAGSFRYFFDVIVPSHLRRNVFRTLLMCVCLLIRAHCWRFGTETGYVFA